MKTVLPLLAEYIGTFIFTFVMISTPNILFIGITLIAVLFLTMPISGGCINPAVSWVMYLRGNLGLYEALLYIVLQFLAAVTSFYVFKILE